MSPWGEDFQEFSVYLTLDRKSQSHLYVVASQPNQLHTSRSRLHLFLVIVHDVREDRRLFVSCSQWIYHRGGRRLQQFCPHSHDGSTSTDLTRIEVHGFPGEHRDRPYLRCCNFSLVVCPSRLRSIQRCMTTLRVPICARQQFKLTCLVTGNSCWLLRLCPRKHT